MVGACSTRVARSNLGALATPHHVNEGASGVNGERFTLSFGVEGMEPLSGTADELKDLLDAYPIHTVQRILLAEKAVEGPAWVALKGYLAKRYVDHFCGR